MGRIQVTFAVIALMICCVHGYTRGYGSRRGQSRNNGWGSCPDACQCMILNQRGTREIPERWGPAPFQSISNVQGDSPGVYGRRMVCQGLRRLPKPIPHGKLLLQLTDINWFYPLTYIVAHNLTFISYTLHTQCYVSSLLCTYQFNFVVFWQFGEQINLSLDNIRNCINWQI